MGKLFWKIQAKDDKLWVKDKIKETDAWAAVLQTGRYKTTVVYKELHGYRGHVPLKHMLYQNYAKPRARFIIWLSLLGQLNTKDRLLKHGNVINAGCIFCREEETLHRLLLECHITKQIWRRVLQNIGYDRNPVGWTQERLWLIGETRRKGWHMDMVKIAIAESVYGIWRHCNDVIFNHAHVDPQIWKIITHDIFIRSSFHKSIRNYVNIETMSISP
ncbi:uncharacterized protein LOC131648018 [Vicia villosa]|uniref:uncharacterized protein LOC131648018 n=1 Tax=Vicia villosa TaxID=3911 RepID=UPI00273B644D|nr:uncharacterized protein LOC131648018 [Vicia villosa]